MSSAVTTEAVKKTSASALKKYLVDPLVRTANNIENRSATKLAANAAAVAQVKKFAETGEDAASASTARFIQEQRALLSYRVVRLFDESRYVFSGEYFKGYDRTKALFDLRFLTNLLFIFIIFTLVGRRTIYPPIAPDSPFALALQHKVNPNS